MSKTKIISEIGWNHMGDMNLAKEMIHASKENGADFVKFQTWSVDRLKPGPWDEDGRLEIYKKAELTKDQHIELYEYSNTVDIEFFSSVFSVDDAELLSEIQTKYVKIASFESRNPTLLSYCDSRFDKIFVSTGTSSVSEIEEHMNYLPTSDIVLLHCISSYPLEPKNTNLPRIDMLRDVEENVGYSDHTFGIEGAKISLEYNPCVIEKHFTIDQSLPGRDNKFAILPHQLKELSDYIKMREEMNINHGSGYLECEQEARDIMTGRFDG
jgi:N,N'-diacetyllegionaminate synthase